jgi:hypothetical protein
LREVANKTLKEYFGRIGWDPGVQWDKLTETTVQPLFDAIQSAPEATRGRINEDFRQINEMATEGGIRTIIDEGRFRKLDLGTALQGVGGLHDQVLRVFLDYPAKDVQPSLFDVARRFNRSDNVAERSWRKRSGVPEVKHAKSRDDETAKKLEEGRKRLEEALSSYYKVKEGRGHHCVVEHFERDDSLYWFAYVQDYEEARIEYVGDKLDRRTCKGVFEVIFRHSNAKRMLEIHVKGDRDTVADLQTLWARAVLDSDDLGTPPERGIEYNLNLLKTKRQFPFRLEDGLRAVRVSALRLSYIGDRKNRRITLEANTRKAPNVVFDLMDELLSSGKLSPDIVNITQVVMSFVFAADTRSGTKTVPARITHPDSCSLKHEPKEEVAREYLREWKIDVTEGAQPDPQGV